MKILIEPEEFVTANGKRAVIDGVYSDAYYMFSGYIVEADGQRTKKIWHPDGEASGSTPGSDISDDDKTFEELVRQTNKLFGRPT